MSERGHTAHLADSDTDLRFLDGDGEMARMIRSHDWSATTLGPPGDWPQALRTCVRLMLNTRHPIFMFWGPDALCLYNDGYRAILGRERHAMALGNSGAVVWDEIWHIIGPQVEQVMAGRGATWHENDLIPLTRDGKLEETFWTYSYSPIDDEGAVGGVLVLVTETTQTVLAEHRRAEETERQRRLFDQAPSFVCITQGPDHVFEFVNQAHRHLFNSHGWVGTPLREAFPDIEGQGFYELMDQVYATGERYNANAVAVRFRAGPDAVEDERLLDFVYEAITDDGGNITGIFCEGFDVTERHLAEQASRESQLQLEVLTNALPQQVWTARPDGHLDYINQRTIDYAGDVAIVDGIVQWATIVHPDDLQTSMPVWQRSLETGEPYEAEQRIFHKDSQSYRWNLSRALALRDADGEIMRWIGTNTDIEDSRAAQQAMLDARNAAEAANIAKSEFLANMSHEIRTPMNAVIGLSTLLSKSSPLTQRQREFIKTLQMSADSLLALINDLLDIAKIEARTVELEHIPFSLTRIVQEVASMMAVPVRDKGLKFTGEGDCAENSLFMGDPTRLRQIITNLCSNAIKFTSEGGIHVAITCHDTDDDNIQSICIAVSDTGIGIAPDHIETIFQKFTQADSSINRKYGGTGLGLAITKTLVEIMGGTISVQSKLGLGSTFTVCIPLEIAPDHPGGAQPSMNEMLEFAIDNKVRAHVLLVEDYEPNVLVARTFLEDFGYRVDVATNGLEAFEKVKTGRYVVVLMDVQMHGLNGLDATRMIRTHEQQHGRPRMPIIGMTAHALAGDRERCLGVGMDDYVAKPFNPDELRTKITAFQT